MKRHLSSQKPCGTPFVPEKLRGYDKHAAEYLFLLTRSETESIYEFHLLPLKVLIIKNNSNSNKIK